MFTIYVAVIVSVASSSTPSSDCGTCESALRNNGLSIFFLAALVGQAVAGHVAYNEEQIAPAEPLDETPETISLAR
jgi:hypothetical protein